MSVQTWRYSGPNQQGQGWFVAFVDSIGCLAVLSDYGDYAYRWNAPGGTGAEFRLFLTQCDSSYVLSKLTRRDEFQGAATEDAIREHILALRREGEISKDRAQDEWDGLPAIGNEVEFADWLHSTELPDAYDLCVYDVPAQAKAFMEHVWPRLMNAVRADLQTAITSQEQRT